MTRKSIHWIILIVFVPFVYAKQATMTDINMHKVDRPTKQGDVILRSELWNLLVENYTSDINPDDPQVKLGLTLLSADLKYPPLLYSQIWLRLSWHDSRLAWDTNDFSVDVIRVPIFDIWGPDIRLYNDASYSSLDSCTEGRALINSSGDVRWVSNCRVVSPCNTTLNTHPCTPQSCDLKFGSWAYDKSILDIDFMGEEASVDMSEWQDLYQWKVLSTSGYKTMKFNSWDQKAYAQLTFNVTFQRKPDVTTGLCGI